MMINYLVCVINPKLLSDEQHHSDKCKRHTDCQGIKRICKSHALPPYVDSNHYDRFVSVEKQIL